MGAENIAGWKQYLVFGKLSFSRTNHSSLIRKLKNYTADNATGKSHLEPIYPSTEKLKAKGINGRVFSKFTAEVFKKITEKDLPENLPDSIIKKFKFIKRYDAYKHIHFPASPAHYQHAVRRLKFEEFFFAQLSIQLIKISRQRFSKGSPFEKVGNLFNEFYKNYLPFSLTGAQQRVLKEIRKDTGSGHQMNRLLQGDVGSGKTMVALLSMLIVADNGFQSVLMAPTEILAQQHFNSIKELTKELPVKVELLTGSTKTKRKNELLQQCGDGSISILVGTHAIIEDKVVFKNLGFAVVDEQHKFGVAQRARLWKKMRYHRIYW